jgi:hypothetical protein
MTSDGTAYVGWIASSSGGPRKVNVCVLPLGANKCKGGVQKVDGLGSTAANLKMVVVSGTPTLLWFHNTATSGTDPNGGAIAAATVNGAGVLSAGSDVASARSNGALFDAEIGPGGKVWTITSLEGLSQYIRIHEAGVTMAAPWNVGFADLAFDGSKPIVVATDYGAITTPPSYAYGKGGGFSEFNKVAKTWAVGTSIGLTATSSGVRLTTGIDNTSYSPVVAKWTGKGFGHPAPTGDKNACAPDSHDTSADKSGRLIDVTNECGKITVSNLPNTTRASVLRFKAGGTVAGSNPQIVSSPRGHAWVSWGVSDTAAGGSGVKLMVVPFLLPDLHASNKGHGKHGTVTVTGPASCLPADTISVGVKGHPDHGWKVASHHLSLGGKSIGGTLNGAALKPGKQYALKGVVTFANGSSHSKGSATLKFRSCPNP